MTPGRSLVSWILAVLLACLVFPGLSPYVLAAAWFVAGLVIIVSPIVGVVVALAWLYTLLPESHPEEEYKREVRP